METDPGKNLEERMERLQGRLNQVRDESDADNGAKSGGKGYSQALKLSSEFVGAVVVGAMIGYLLDLVLPTKPWGLIVFLLLGFCAGVLNVLRAAGAVNSPHPVDRLGAQRGDDKKR